MIYYADVFKTLNLYGWIFYIFWSLEYKSSWLCWFSWLFYCLPVTGLADVGLDWHDIWCRYPWSPEEESHWLVVILWRFMVSPHQVSISLCPTLWFRCRPKGSLSCILCFMLVNMLTKMMKHGGNKSCSFSSGQFYIFIFICVLPVAFRLNNTLLLSIPDCCSPNFPVAVFFFFLSFYFLTFDIQLSPYSIFKFGCVQIMAQETKCCGDATTLSCGNCTFTAWTHPPQPCGADTNDCSSLASSIQYHYNVCLS